MLLPLGLDDHQLSEPPGVINLGSSASSVGPSTIYIQALLLVGLLLMVITDGYY